MLSRRQHQIVRESIAIIAEEGIQSLTTKNLAARVGVTEPALYRHFAGKSAILSAVIDQFDSISASVMASVAGADPSPLLKIEQFILDRYRRFAADPPLAKVMLSEEIFQNDPVLSSRLLAMMHQHKKVIAKWLTQAQAAGLIRADVGPKELFRILLGPMRLLVKQWALSGGAFELISEGEALWAAQKRMLAPLRPEGLPPAPPSAAVSGNGGPVDA